MSEPEFVERAREYQRTYYQAHRQKKIEYQRAYQAAHQDEINARRRKAKAELRNMPRGIQARTKAEYNRRYHLEIMVERNLRERVRALQRVSGQAIPSCRRCGETDIRVLILNHLNADGGLERKGGRDGRWITRAVASGEREVSDLEVLCYNCNILFEYDRGYRRLPRDWQSVVDEEVTQWLLTP